MNREKYQSVNGTLINIQKNIVIKTYYLKTINKKYKSRIKNLIEDYFFELHNNGIPVPRLIKSNENLEFHFSYCGQSIFSQLSGDNFKEIIHDNNIILQIVDICNNAISNDINFDPHIKNFTIKNGQIFYVDVFPPLNNAYIKILIKANSQNKNRIKEQFNLFSPKLIANHFIADIQKSFPNKEQILEVFSQRFLEYGLLDKINKSLINNIIAIENQNHGDSHFSLS